MFAVLIGHFYYSGEIEVKVRDFSVGTYHNSIARDCGDGEEFLVLYVNERQETAESFAEHLKALPELWRPVFLTKHGTLNHDASRDQTWGVTSEILNRMS